MQTTKIIQQARGMAQRFAAGKNKQMRLPVFDFDDFLDVYSLSADGASLTQFRDHCRRTWYLMHFMRGLGMDPVPIQVTAGGFEKWLENHPHDTSDGHELAHAVGDYINDPAVRPAQCEHSSEIAGLAKGVALATITMFGEDPDMPEVVGVALHLHDGQVIETMEVVTAEHSPDEAWNMVQGFLDQHQPRRVFKDDTVRRPEFCSDCGALLSNVASVQDVDAAT